MEFMNFEDLNYIFIKPKEFDETKQYPVILHLHGAGSRGSDLNLLSDNPFYHHLNTYESFPFVVFGPQCHLDTWFDLFEQLRRFSQYIAGLNFTDASRIYLMGASMGAYATWQLATSLPEVFAAAVPICGGGMYWNAERRAGLGVSWCKRRHCFLRGKQKDGRRGEQKWRLCAPYSLS